MTPCIILSKYEFNDSVSPLFPRIVRWAFWKISPSKLALSVSFCLFFLFAFARFENSSTSRMDSSVEEDAKNIEMTIVAENNAFPARVVSLTGGVVKPSPLVNKKKVYECDKCGKKFNKSFNMKRHAAKVCWRPMTTVEPAKAVCPLCSFEDVKQAMPLHFETSHGVELVKREILFESRIEFSKWKAAKEKETSARYVQSRGIRPSKNGLTKVTYYCHRDGHFKSKGMNLRRTKAIGSNKINGHCPARMDVTQLADGSISLRFVSTHLGHSMDSERLHLTDSERERVARQIQCQSVVVSDGEEEEAKVCNLTAESLVNISRSFNWRQYVRRREVSETFDDWIDSILESSNMVRLYEKHGEEFVVVAAMDSQIEILKRCGNKVILLEPVSVNFWCLLVVDDISEGFPCAFSISSVSKNSLRKLLTTIKALTGDIQPRLLISDFEGHSAWADIFPSPVTKALAPWHINLVCENEEAANSLIRCAQLTEGDEFLKAFKEASSKISVPDILKDDFSLWACCLQEPFTQEAVNTLSHSVRLLKHLAKVYSATLSTDKLLYILIKATRDQIFDRVLVLNNSHSTIRQRRLETRHKLSLKMSLDNVVENSENTFTIPGAIDSYTVKRSSELTCTSCHTVCHECRACLHEYNCTCFDSAIKGNMCRHIHVVCQYLLDRQQKVGCSEDVPDPDDVPPSHLLMIQKRQLTQRCLAMIESIKTSEDLINFESVINNFESNLPPSDTKHGQTSYVLELVTNDDTVGDIKEGQQFVMVLEDGRNAKVELVKA